MFIFDACLFTIFDSPIPRTPGTPLKACGGDCRKISICVSHRESTNGLVALSF